MIKNIGTINLVKKHGPFGSKIDGLIVVERWFYNTSG